MFLRHKSIFVILSFTLVSFGTIAQKDFQPGFIINLSGDTVRGQVLVKESNARFETCAFMNSGSETSYTPDQVSGYGIINQHSYSTKNLTLVSAEKPVFAEVLALGKASLFQVYKRYFLEKDGEVVELTESKVVIEREGKQYRVSDRKFQKDLATKMADCQTIKSLIASSRLQTGPLVKVFERYNVCVGGANSYKATVRRVKFSGGLSFGLASNTLNNLKNSQSSSMKHSGLLDLTDRDQFSTNSITFPGVSFELTSGRWAGHVDIFFQNNNTFSSVFANGTTTHSITLKYQSIALPISVAYYFLKEKSKVRIFAEAGMSVYMNTGTNVSWKRQSSVTGATDYPSLKYDVPGNVLFFGGAGVTYAPADRFTLVGKVRFETGPFDNDIRKSSVSETFTVLYRFSK